MTATTGILIEPDALLDARRELLRRGLALDDARVHRPDTGPTTVMTVLVLDRVAAVVDSVIYDLHGLADALDQLVEDLADQDGRVGAMFDLLSIRSRA